MSDNYEIDFKQRLKILAGAVFDYEITSFAAFAYMRLVNEFRDYPDDAAAIYLSDREFRKKIAVLNKQASFDCRKELIDAGLITFQYVRRGVGLYGFPDKFILTDEEGK